MASNYSSVKTSSETKLIKLKLISQDGPKVQGHVACVHNNAIYVHGGLINKNDRIPSNKLYKFDFQNGWKDISLLPFLFSCLKSSIIICNSL